MQEADHRIVQHDGVEGTFAYPAVFMLVQGALDDVYAKSSGGVIPGLDSAWSRESKL